MLVVESIFDLVQHGSPDVAVTFGNFDGVHVGHQRLIKYLKDKAVLQGLKLTVITFVPHPRKILQAHLDRFLLGSYAQRRLWLKALGVDVLVEIPFTRDFSTKSATDFLDADVLKYSHLKSIYLGWDFAFGAHKTGDAALVKNHCQGKGLTIEVCPEFPMDGKPLSSTAIRDDLALGNVEGARVMLGRPFALEGVVVKGEGRGRRIGVPTANMQIHPDIIIPLRGVYITETTTKGMLYRSVTNIGLNPTFQDTKILSVETHLLDFNDDIYGETLEVQFIKRLRDERKFPTVNDLMSQIAQDIKVARSASLD